VDYAPTALKVIILYKSLFTEKNGSSTKTQQYRHKYILQHRHTDETKKNENAIPTLLSIAGMRKENEKARRRKMNEPKTVVIL